MIDRIFKPKGSRIWRWRIRLRPEDVRIEDISLGTSDKQVAEKRRTDLRREKEHERGGLLHPKPIRESALRHMAQHLAEFLSDMRRRGKSEKYLSNLEFRVSALVVACGWTLPTDVTADSFQRWGVEHKDLAAKTQNDYLEAARCLFNWMVKHGRVVSNPLVTLEKVSMVGRETRERRAFTDEEMGRLLDAAGERKTVYMMAVYTGLRRSEIASLKWSDLTLDGATAFVQVRASTTKNGKSAAMRLHPDLLPALVELKSRAAGDSELVFPRMPRIERFKRDLKKAGVAYKDGQDRYADFHALRKTFGTNLQRAGVASRVAMKAMRHSDRRLTDKIYTDENMLDTWSAIGGLSSFTGQASLIASQNLGAGGQNVSLPVTTSAGAEVVKTIVNIGDCHGLASSVTTGQNAGNGGSGGARTRNLCRDRAAL
jgi:integrase